MTYRTSMRIATLQPSPSLQLDSVLLADVTFAEAVEAARASHADTGRRTYIMGKDCPRVWFVIEADGSEENRNHGAAYRHLATQYTVTIRKADGYTFNHLVQPSELREFLARAASVLFAGETLSYAAA